ncbi:MAG: hypothetical protein H7833_00415 [Magnetococcus sp. DMHC-1]
MLVNAITLIETWAIDHKRKIQPGKLGQLVLMLCQEYVEECRQNPDNPPVGVLETKNFKKFLDLAT